MADYDLQYQDTHIDALLATANELKTAGYIYKGVATPSTNPGTPTERVAYLASEPGTYTNFGGIVITSGLYSLTYAGGTWTATQMQAGSDIEVVQTTGQSTTSVMSQKAVTDEIDIIKKGVEIVSYSSYLRNQQALSSSGNWRTRLADMVSAVIPCKANALYRIENVGATYTRYAFFKNNSLTNNQPAPFCSGYSGNGTYLEQGDIVTITSPSDAKYLYVVINNHNVDSHVNIEQVSEFYNYIKDNFVQGVNVENNAQVISLAGNGTTAVVSGYIPVSPNTPYTLVSSLKTWTMPSSISGNTGFRVSEHETNSGSAVWADVRYTLGQIETDGLPDKMHFTTKHLTNYVRFTIIAPVGTIINLTLAESIDLQDINETLSRDEKTQQNVVGTYSGEKIVLNSLQTYNKFQFMQFNEEKLIFQSMDFCSVSGTDYGIFILKPYDAETPYGWIYNMSRRLKMQDITFPIPSGYSLCHANTSFFLKDKYSESSVLPMFAINMWQLEKVVFIYDFIEETVTDELLNTYTQIKPVLRYTIEPDSNIRNLGTYIDFISDNDQNYLWALGWTMNCYKFPFPNLEAGTETTIGDFTFKKSVLAYSSRIENFACGNMTGFQDKCYCNGKIFVNYGYANQTPTLAIAVIDVVAKSRSNTIDLSNDMNNSFYRIPYVENRETQGIAVLDNKLMITYWKENILWQMIL